MPDEPTVFLIDDDRSVRDALKWLIESIHLSVRTFASAGKFLTDFDPARPGCLVADVRMPRMSGLELQLELRARNASIPIILITGHGDVPMCVRAFENGAFGFLEKPVNEQQLLDSIQRAIEDDRKNRQEVVVATDLTPRIERLTERERELMELLVAGKSMKQIATRLDISLPTCSKHRARLLEKMQVQNDVELVRLVLTGKAL